MHTIKSSQNKCFLQGHIYAPKNYYLTKRYKHVYIESETHYSLSRSDKVRDRKNSIYRTTSHIRTSMNTQTSALVQEAFSILGVTNFFDLSRAYTREDQKLFVPGMKDWNPRNPDLLINRIKSIMEKIDPNELDEEDAMWRTEILWFWYHHGISWAIWKDKDKVIAQVYADEALVLQGKNPTNRITKLLWFLVHDKLTEGRKWLEEKPDDPDHQTGLELIHEFEEGLFF